MKKFSQILRKKINEAKLPENYEDMSKEELIKLMAGNTVQNQNAEVAKDPFKDENEKPIPTVDPCFSKMKNNIENKKSDVSNISKFISKLLESREMAQVYHWTVKGDEGSHAAHKALEEYYEGVIDFIDQIVEVYSGQYGLIEGYDIIDTSLLKEKEKINYFEEVVNFVKSERKCINAEDTHLHNIVDEVIALIYRTIYKLKFNK